MVLDKSFTFGVISAVVSGSMVGLLTFTGMAARESPSPLRRLSALANPREI